MELDAIEVQDRLDDFERRLTRIEQALSRVLPKQEAKKAKTALPTGLISDLPANAVGSMTKRAGE